MWHPFIPKTLTSLYLYRSFKSFYFFEQCIYYKQQLACPVYSEGGSCWPRLRRQSDLVPQRWWKLRKNSAKVSVDPICSGTCWKRFTAARLKSFRSYPTWILDGNDNGHSPGDVTWAKDKHEGRIESLSKTEDSKWLTSFFMGLPECFGLLEMQRVQTAGAPVWQFQTAMFGAMYQGQQLSRFYSTGFLLMTSRI